jgi:hypothetical protein
MVDWATWTQFTAKLEQAMAILSMRPGLAKLGSGAAADRATSLTLRAGQPALRRSQLGHTRTLSVFVIGKKLSSFVHTAER